MSTPLRTLLVLTLALSACKTGSQTPAKPSQDDSQQISGWHEYGGQNAAKFSPLKQINRNNIGELEVAWTHNSGDVADGSGEWGFTSLQVTPLVIADTLYYCTPFGRVFALAAETGEQRWVFDPEVKNKHSGLYPAVCRGVSYWQTDTPSGGSCDERIVYGTRDAELIALDAKTGKPCDSFGNNGRLSLKEDIEGANSWEYYPTSPPYIINNLAVVGATVPDNDRKDVPSGVVRAFDVRTGELAWAWEPVSREYRERHQDERGNTRFHLGSPNVWAPISGDPQRQLVFIPTGNPSPDLYGGDRDGIDYFGSSVIALDAKTGELNWRFQTVHHDVWDYDVASQPTLFELPGVGEGRPGIAQATKMGHIFLLDRETGEPLYPVIEKPVPQGGVSGETLSPTQPFPTHPAPLHLPQKLEADDMDGFVWFDRKSCQRRLASYRNDGIFTPPSIEGSVLYPTTTGGINWGGITIDPEEGILYANQMHMAAVVQLIPRAEYDALNPSAGYPLEHYPMKGSPYGVRRFPLLSSVGAPCNPRPWGSLTAVNLRSGEVLWRRPLGTTKGLAPWPLWFEAGSPNIGGGLATAGKLFFIAASSDGYFRAFDSLNGEELWRHALPYTGNATPISYRVNESGAQYVVIAAGGHGWSSPGDAIVAFRLKSAGDPTGDRNVTISNN